MEVRELRKRISSKADNSIVFNKGDRRVHIPRVCCVCKRELSTHSSDNQTFWVSVRHTRNKYGELNLDMCTDIRSCRAQLSRKEGDAK